MNQEQRLGRRVALRTIAVTALSPLALPPIAKGGHLDDGFDQLVRQHGFDQSGPGLAVYVHTEGRPPFLRCTGLATLSDNQPVTLKTMFELASVSKPLTATAVLILHDQAKLAISDPIRKYIPELPEYDRERPIRISDLLQHVSGLPSYLDFKDVPSKHNGHWVNEDYVGEFARQNVPLDFPTGQKFAYNNSNYILLAVLAARVSGMSFGAFLRHAVFGPAGMTTAFVNESWTSAPPGAARVNAIGYTKDGSGWREIWGAPPARKETMLQAGDGGIWCSLEDVAAWDRAVRAGTLLKPETATMALVPSRTSDGQTNDYGMGWELILDRSGRMTSFGHTGGWGGFRTYYFHQRATRQSIAFLGNGRHVKMDEFASALSGLVERHERT